MVQGRDYSLVGRRGKSHRKKKWTEQPKEKRYRAVSKLKYSNQNHNHKQSVQDKMPECNLQHCFLSTKLLLLTQNDYLYMTGWE